MRDMVERLPRIRPSWQLPAMNGGMSDSEVLPLVLLNEEFIFLVRQAVKPFAWEIWWADSPLIPVSRYPYFVVPKPDNLNCRRVA